MAWPRGRDGFPSKGQTMTGGDGDLEFDEIEAGDLLGDGMLDLQARVHFEKIEIEMGVDEEFDGAGVDVAAGARQAHRGFAHFVAKIGRHDGGGSFFDDFLMAALDGAFAFAERDDTAVRVGEDLDFDVTRLFKIFLEVETRESPKAFSASEEASRTGGAKLGAAWTRRMPLPPPPATALRRTGIAHRLCEGVGFVGVFDGIVGAGDGRDVGAARELATGSFRAQGFHGSAEGPMKVIPASAQARGRAGFSARKP